MTLLYANSPYSRVNFNLQFKRTWPVGPFYFNISDDICFAITVCVSVYLHIGVFDTFIFDTKRTTSKLEH